MLHQFPEKIITNEDFIGYDTFTYKKLTFATMHRCDGIFDLFVQKSKTEDKTVWIYIGNSYSAESGEQAVHSFVALHIGNNRTMLDRIKEMI